MSFNLLKYLCNLLTIAGLMAHEVYIPKGFEENPVLEKVILISDVDGVVRDSILTPADPRVVVSVKRLLEGQYVDMSFVSGTPIDHDMSLEAWRRGNFPLSGVFGSSFQKELLEKEMTIYGVFGAHRMKPDGSVEIVDEFSLETSFELTRYLIEAFLKEVQMQDDLEQKALARDLEEKLGAITLQDTNQSTSVTAIEFDPIVRVIRERIDPNFRVINYGPMMETHTSNPPWGTGLFASWLREKLDEPGSLASFLRPEQKQIATGRAKCGDQPFNFFLISKTDKGITTKKHIEDRLKKYPRALIITIGDTQFDFLMHRNAHLAFHVGLEKVWQDQSLPQCTMVRNAKGEDAQHVEGTLKVLALIQNALGKPFYDFKYIPVKDFSGHWDFYSLNEIKRDLD